MPLASGHFDESEQFISSPHLHLHCFFVLGASSQSRRVCRAIVISGWKTKRSPCGTFATRRVGQKTGCMREMWDSNNIRPSTPPLQEPMAYLAHNHWSQNHWTMGALGIHDIARSSISLSSRRPCTTTSRPCTTTSCP